MLDEPDAIRLLTAVADVLEQKVLPLAEIGVRHDVRVAASLCRILTRELELDSAADRRARAELAEILGHGGTTQDLWGELAERLLPASDAPMASTETEADNLQDQAYPVVLSIVRDRIAISKPGYDSYTFTDE